MKLLSIMMPMKKRTIKLLKEEEAMPPAAAYLQFQLQII